MSFILDPPALFLVGWLLYNLSKRYRWELKTTVLIGAFITFVLFMGGSSLLYLDVIYWPIPWTKGSIWMFHTDYTGIHKTDVPAFFAALMLLIYPIWSSMGYLFALKSDLGSLVLPILNHNDVKSKKPVTAPAYVVRRGDSPRELVRDAVSNLGGISAFVKAGDNVIIKPNICGGNPWIPGTFTDIKVIDEIVKMVKEVGASPIVVDSDMIWTDFHPVAKEQGWIKWANEEWIDIRNLGDSEWVRFNFGKDSAIGIVPVSKLMVEADVIINVPTMKTHLLTNITIAMKNMYGTFPEAAKAKFHRFAIEDVIYEVNDAFTPNLTIIDGTMGGEGFGPLSCRPLYYQTIIASNDVVAADSIACQLMGYEPMEVVHIKKGHDMGLGKGDVIFDMTTLPYKHAKDGKWRKPDPKVTEFYEGLVEACLMVPGMQALFDVAADFILYGLATLPVFIGMTPEVEAILNDILKIILNSGVSESKHSKEDRDAVTWMVEENHIHFV